MLLCPLVDTPDGPPTRAGGPPFPAGDRLRDLQPILTTTGVTNYTPHRPPPPIGPLFCHTAGVPNHAITVWPHYSTSRDPCAGWERCSGN